MEAFGKSRQEYLAKFLELSNGIPDSDTFKRVFEKLNPYTFLFETGDHPAMNTNFEKFYNVSLDFLMH